MNRRKAMNYRQIFEVKNKLKQDLLKVNSKLNNNSGIYVFTRYDENGFKYAYIGQALHLLDRLVSHLQGYIQWIDLSLKKHKLKSEQNPYGWNVSFINCDASNLNEIETQTIKQYADYGYQLRNKTGGSQGEGKFGIVDNQRKGYLQGKNDGKIATLRQIKVYFDKYLDCIIKGDTNKIKQRKLQEFREMLNEADNRKED